VPSSPTSCAPRESSIEPASPDATFEATFREHFAYVWRSARALVGDNLADDVTQEAFLVARRRMSDYEGPSMQAWLYGITRNVARNAIRAAGRRARRSRGDPLSRDLTPRWVRVHDAALLMQMFLDRLSVPQREAFMLKELEGLTGSEISQATGVPLQTVYSRVQAANEALRRFREQLERDGGGHESA